MTPQLAFRHPLTESDLILSDFLHELDELDCFQDISQEFIDSKFRQDLNVVAESVNVPAAPKKRRSTSWLRRKQELTALRSESEALETHLTFLRMEIDRQTSLQQRRPTDSGDSGMWRSVALIARQERETSQNENERLKNEMQMYARASEMLQRQLAAAEGRRQQLLSSALMNEGRLGKLLPIPFDNEGVLDLLEQRIDARFHELAWIMLEAHRPAQGGTSVQICREENHSAAAVEFQHVRLLPFGEDTMATTIWEIIELGGVVTRTNTRVVRITSNMVGMVSRHSVPFGCKASVDVDVHTVIKRLDVSTGMVALIESHSEWSIKYPGSEVLRSTTEEGGWVVVHEYALQSSNDANQRASQLRTSVKLRPKEYQGGNSTSLTSTIVDVVVPSFRDILSSHHQSVENFLLDSKHTGMENRRAQDMTPLLETCTLPVSLDTFASDFVLSEFLNEMDELERLQTPKHKCTESKRQRGPGMEIEPELKKIKLSKQDQPQASMKPKRRNTSWLRRKHELQALRSESEALETQVAFLQLQREHKAAVPFPEMLTEGQEMWKSVALIAQVESQNSQSENARLKTELQTCAWAFEKFHTQLIQANSQREKQSSSKFSFENAMRVGIIMSHRLHPGTNEVFKKLESKLAARFFELDVIARAAYESSLEGASEQVRVCRKDGREAASAVEFKHARLLPFAQDTTADTIWEMIKLGGVISDKHFRVTRRSNDVVGMSSRFTIPLDRSNSNTVNVDVHAVAKRFAAPVGMVVLVESCSEWSVSHPTSAVWKETTEEEGYVVVNELPHRSDDATPHTCHVQTNMKLRPNGCGGARPTFTGNIGDVVIPSFREIVSSHFQSVENFLLDSSRTVRA